MKAVVVYESMFDNTAEIAAAVADGLGDGGVEVTLVPASEASATTGADADLLVVGAPTHGFTLSTPRSRAAARQQGAAVDPSAAGLREWLSHATGTTVAAAAFDTRARSARHWPGSAARKAARILRHHGAALKAHPTSFYVMGTKGPLVEGESTRAENWGQRLAHQMHATSGRRAS